VDNEDKGVDWFEVATLNDSGNNVKTQTNTCQPPALVHTHNRHLEDYAKEAEERILKHEKRKGRIL